MKSNLRLKKTAVMLGMILAGSLTGCGSKDNVNSEEVSSEQEFLLKDTIFEKALVANVDGQVAILKKERENILGLVYFDIISGENISENKSNDNIRMVEDIYITGSVFEYLTKEDMKKLVNRKFTKEDEVELISRIKGQFEEENNNQKVNKLTNEN